MTYPSTGPPPSPAWGPPYPYAPQMHLQPTGPQPSSALAIISFIMSLIAFFFGWIPFLGILLGALGLILAIFAIRMPVLRGLAVAAIILSTIAALTSLVTTGIFVLAMFSGGTSTTGTKAVTSYAPEDFVEIDDRTLAGIAKDPDVHAGETLILYGYVTQFDANTGPCEMRVSVSATKQSSWIDYEHNSLAFSGDGDSECPELEDVISDDEVKLTVVLEGGSTYSSLGGSTRVPYFEVIDAEVLQ